MSQTTTTSHHNPCYWRNIPTDSNHTNTQILSRLQACDLWVHNDLGANTITTDHLFANDMNIGDLVLNNIQIDGSINGCNGDAGNLLVGQGTSFGCLPRGPDNSILISKGPTLEWSSDIIVDSVTTMNGTVAGTLTYGPGGHALGTLLTITNTGVITTFDPTTPSVAPVGGVLTYSGTGAYGVHWSLPTPVCTDRFGITVGDSTSTVCVEPLLLNYNHPGQLLVYDGNGTTQNNIGSGVKWAAINASSITQILYYEPSTLSPEYNIAAASGPSVLTVNSTSTAPSWISAFGSVPGSVLQYNGSSLIWSLPSPVPICTDIFSVTVGNGISTVCVEPSNLSAPGQLLVYDGNGIIQDSLGNGVKWAATNAWNITQMLYFEPLESAPKYNIAASSGPAVLTVDSSLTTAPIWVSASGAPVNSVLQYNGSSLVWGLPSPVPICTDIFGATIGDGISTVCVEPSNLSAPGQLLVYDGNGTTQNSLGIGVKWAAINASSITQIIYYEPSTLSPEYNIAAASGPSVLTVDSSLTTEPTWVSAFGSVPGSVLQFNGSSLVWGLPSPVPICTDIFGATIGDGLSTVCVEPSNLSAPGQLLVYDGNGITQNSLGIGVKWAALNASSITQILYYEPSTLSPEYNIAAASGPSVLTVDSSLTTAPVWVSAFGSVPGSVLQYNGSSLVWGLPSLVPICIDIFGATIGDGLSTVCVEPSNLSAPGQLLVYDGNGITQNSLGIGVKWAATNASSITQILYYEPSTLSPEYNIAALSGPSVLTVDSTLTTEPTWISAFGTPVGSVLQYNGSSLVWSLVTVSGLCTDLWSLTVGDGASNTVCVEPVASVPGQILAYDGSATQGSLNDGVQWTATNANVTSSSQVLHYDSTASLPTYNTAATDPSVLKVEPTGTDVPTWQALPNLYDTIINVGGGMLFYGYSGLNSHFFVSSDGASSVNICPDSPATTHVQYNIGTAVNTDPTNYTTPSTSSFQIATIGTYLISVSMTYLRGAGSTSSTSTILRVIVNGTNYPPGYCTAGVPSAGSSGSGAFSTAVPITVPNSIIQIGGTRSNTGGGPGQPLMTGNAFVISPAVEATGPCTLLIARMK